MCKAERIPENKRVYMISQPNAQTLTLIHEVTGLDKLQRFRGSCKLEALKGK